LVSTHSILDFGLMQGHTSTSDKGIWMLWCDWDQGNALSEL